MRDQRDLQKQHLNQDLLPGIKSQFARINMIKETVNTNSDRTLGEKICTLFRDQGITIVSILTAIGFAISTLVSSITSCIKAATLNPQPRPSPKPGPKPGPQPGPKPTPSIKDWVKQILEKNY